MSEYEVIVLTFKMRARDELFRGTITAGNDRAVLDFAAQFIRPDTAVVVDPLRSGCGGGFISYRSFAGEPFVRCWFAANGEAGITL
jgi:hypothetical protein